MFCVLYSMALTPSSWFPSSSLLALDPQLIPFLTSGKVKGLQFHSSLSTSVLPSCLLGPH